MMETRLVNIPDPHDCDALAQTRQSEVRRPQGGLWDPETPRFRAVSAGTSGHGIREMTIESLLHGQG
jgi:hypothetical protein